MTPELPWHHIHITIADRAAAAAWHARHSMAERRTPTPRSENLMYGPNLLQIQSEAVAPPPRGAAIESLGLTVADPASMLAAWIDAGARLTAQEEDVVRVQDPFGTPFELVEGEPGGFTQINLVSARPAELIAWYAGKLGGKTARDRGRARVQFDTMAITVRAGEPPVTAARIPDHLGWYTADLDATFAHLSAEGVQFPVPPRGFGAVRLAFGQDPCGIWFELVEPPGGEISKPVSS